ncbi:hypothetical protein BSLG_004222 [Batrachochytrium salamandrivorans]|nr:hypothetical protein BSLG_004222 [Batrachochytrium salamandrivorans]
MGATQSTDGSEIVGDTHGYHVMQVVPNSPAFKAGLEVYFDYITHASDIVVIPEKNDYGLLGCSVRFVISMACRIISGTLLLHADSPAETAGLCPQTDYIIGTPHTSLEDKDEFYTLVKKHSGIHYNFMYTILSWTRLERLGCDVGYGRLHRISRGKLHSSSPGSNGQDHTGHHHDDASSKDREHSHSHINGEDEHQGTPPAAAAAATMPTACTDPIHHPGHHDEHNISSQRPSSESNPDMESNALPATELDHLLHALDHTQQ